MRKGLLVVLFGARLLVAQAQENTADYTRADTVQAVHRLFQAKRKGGGIFIGVGIPLTLIGATTALFGTTFAALINGGHGNEGIVPATLISGGIGLVPVGVGAVKRIRFSRHREKVVLDAYRAGKPLPGRIKQRLKARYF